MKDEMQRQVSETVRRRLEDEEEIDDGKVDRVIDEALLDAIGDRYIPLAVKLSIKKDVFNSIRRFDVLSNLLEDEDITEIRIVINL